MNKPGLCDRVLAIANWNSEIHKMKVLVIEAKPHRTFFNPDQWDETKMKVKATHFFEKDKVVPAQPGRNINILLLLFWIGNAKLY